jgi:hypothetical protein
MVQKSEQSSFFPYPNAGSALAAVVHRSFLGKGCDGTVTQTLAVLDREGLYRKTRVGGGTKGGCNTIHATRERS